MSKPDRLYIGIYTYSSLIQSSNLSSLLDAFESQDGLKPTHWSSDDPEGSEFSGYQSYERDSFFAKVTNLQEYNELPSLYRREVPQYNVLIENTHIKFNCINVEFEKKIRIKDVPDIYSWAGALVSSIDVEMAFLDPAWDNSGQKYTYCTGIKSKDYQSCGLDSIAARTWFGSYLVNLIGRDRLHNCGGYAQDTESGGVMLDLVEEPWNADLETLSEAQKKIKENLEVSGVFGDYTKAIKCKPGINWSPFPQPAKNL